MSKIYKVNMNKYTKYITHINPNIRKEASADSDDLTDWLHDNLKHQLPEYVIDVIVPALHAYVTEWCMKYNDYDIEKSSASILIAIGMDLAAYGKFLMEEGGFFGK